jgi:hypothetical protein
MIEFDGCWFEGPSIVFLVCWAKQVNEAEITAQTWRKSITTTRTCQPHESGSILCILPLEPSCFMQVTHSKLCERPVYTRALKGLQQKTDPGLLATSR